MNASLDSAVSAFVALVSPTDAERALWADVTERVKVPHLGATLGRRARNLVVSLLHGRASCSRHSAACPGCGSRPSAPQSAVWVRFGVMSTFVFTATAEGAGPGGGRRSVTLSAPAGFPAPVYALHQFFHLSKAGQWAVRGQRQQRPQTALDVLEGALHQHAAAVEVTTVASAKVRCLRQPCNPAHTQTPKDTLTRPRTLKVPLLQFADSVTGVDVDITFECLGGSVTTSSAAAAAARRFRAFRPLVLLLKHLLEVSGLLSRPEGSGSREHFAERLAQALAPSSIPLAILHASALSAIPALTVGGVGSYRLYVLLAIALSQLGNPQADGATACRKGVEGIGVGGERRLAFHFVHHISHLAPAWPRGLPPCCCSCVSC